MNSRLSLIISSTSPFRCTTDNSNKLCPKLNSWFLTSPNQLGPKTFWSQLMVTSFILLLGTKSLVSTQFFYKTHTIHTYFVVVIIQSPSHVWLFPIPWTAALQASLSLTISQSLPKFMFIASVMLSSHFILWRPLVLLSSIFPSIRNSSSESAVHVRWPKYCSFSFSINPSNEYSGLISLKIDLISLLSKALSGVFSSTTIWRHQFFSVLPSLGSSSPNCMWPLGRP